MKLFETFSRIQLKTGRIKLKEHLTFLLCFSIKSYFLLNKKAFRKALRNFKIEIGRIKQNKKKCDMLFEFNPFGIKIVKSQHGDVLVSEIRYYGDSLKMERVYFL